MSSQKFSTGTAIAIVIANMIGTGVFTSLGYQLVDIKSTFVLMMLWLVGGVTAFCGALTYAELGSRLPRSGGEYNFLGQIYHRSAGFISGWISATVGFAAPTALAAMTFGAYLEASLAIGTLGESAGSQNGAQALSLSLTDLLGEGVDDGPIDARQLPWLMSGTVMACLLVIALTLVHAFSRAASGGVQTVFTGLKVLLALLFVGLVVWATDMPQHTRLLPAAGDGALLLSGAFAVSLIYVNYAFTGWNAATYILDEMNEPQKTIPWVLATGTLVVLVIYLLLNYAFLYAAPMSEMAGKIEIGVIVADQAFGKTGGRIMGFVLALLLISTVSAMVIAGPRVLQVIGEDFRIFRWLAQRNQNGIPTRAIMAQSALTLLFILTSTFESVLVFTGFVMGLNSFFAVAGVFVLRWREGQALADSQQAGNAGGGTQGQDFSQLGDITGGSGEVHPDLTDGIADSADGDSTMIGDLASGSHHTTSDSRRFNTAIYRTWGYPATPLIFLGLMTWTLVYILIERPEEGLAGLGIITLGGLLYWLTERAGRQANSK